jgi:hypothetical protein
MPYNVKHGNKKTSSEAGTGAQYSSALYAELYNDSAGGGGEAGKSNAGYEEDDEGSSSTSSSNGKRVKFNENVTVKEFAGHRRSGENGLGYANDGGNGIVIDVGDLENRHPWEKFYGAAGSQLDKNDAGGGGGGASSGKADYTRIFTSPYFDYRKTQSRVGI